MLGFLVKTSGVRMAQYEAEARIPKFDFIKEMVLSVSVSTHALNVPSQELGNLLIKELDKESKKNGHQKNLKNAKNEGKIQLNLALILFQLQTTQYRQ
jgi:hypothetical protein